MKRLLSLSALVLVSLLFLFIYMAIYHCSDSVLWYDESGQFFIAKGLNHYSDPYAASGGIVDVIENNRHYNMDPGGFGIILHFWSMISNELWFLRILPCVFFVFFIYYTYRIGLLLTKDNRVAIAVAELLLFLPFAGFMAEIRAYSMEFMGLALTTLYMLKLDTLTSYKKLFFLSLIMCIFCTSRYAFILDAFAAVLFMIGYWFLKKDSQIIPRILTIGIPLLIMVIVIYFTFVRYQNQDVTKMSYLSYLSDDYHNYLNRLSILYYITIALLFYTYKQGGKMFMLNAFAVCLSSVHFIASVFGYHPWDYINFRSASAIYLMMITIIFVLYSFIRSYDWIIKTGLAALCLLSITVMVLSKKHRTSPGNNSIVEAILVSKDMTQKCVFFDKWLSPTMRYLFEYGKLRENAGSLGYPERFIFEKGKRHSQIKSDDEKYPNADDYSCDSYVLHEGAKGLTSTGVRDTTRYSLREGYKYVYIR